MYLESTAEVGKTFVLQKGGYSMKKLMTWASLGVLCSATVWAGEGYYRDQLELKKAWELTRGDSKVKVAVISTGLNYRLPEFNGKVEKDPANGAYGYDAYSNRYDPLDENGVGTEDASLIAGETLGVAPGVKIVPVKVFGKEGSTDFGTVVKGLNYAVSRRVNIIYAGIGLAENAKALCEPLNAAAAAGILVVSPAGNDGSELTHRDYQDICGVDNVLVVAASDEQRGLAYYSKFGVRTVDIAAPGEWIEVMNHYGSIGKGRGTSRSGALAAGVAALVLSYHPDYSAQQLKEAMIRGVSPSSGLQGRVLSNGVLNAYKAMTVSWNLE